MLAGGTDAFYRALLATNPTPVRRAEVWRQGVRVDPYGEDGVPLLEGSSLTATLASSVTRELSLSLPLDLYPKDPKDPAELITPFGNELRVFAGVGASTGYLWPVFRGLIGNVQLGISSTIVSASDIANRISEDPFVSPRNSTTGNRVLDEYRSLVLESVPDAMFGVSDPIEEVVPQLVWSGGRDQACEDLAKAANAFWYALAGGEFVMRRVPWSVAGAPILTLSDGDGGTISLGSPSLSREAMANLVVVTGERPDGGEAVYAMAADEEPTSITFINGPFGRKVRVVSAQGTSSPGQAMGLATGYVRRTRAVTETWTTSMVADASLELGDVVTLQARGRTAVQVLANFTLPLSGAGEMTAGWRSQVTVGVSLGE